MNNLEDPTKKRELCKADRDFLMHTRFLDALPEEAKFHLLVAMKPVQVAAGSRFISQGEEGDCFYIIQNGSCAVSIEKNEVSYPIAVLGPGDMVGEMAILTGENRSAHVDAQTDLDLWRLDRKGFDTICEKYPEVRHFLTQVVSNRFARSSLIADRTVGKYVINEVLGRGGWSIVYKGVHTSLNMPVAVKMLKHNMAMDAEFLENFQNEARTIANLNHENIVKVYDIEHLYRTVFIVMEYLEGGSLQSLMKEVPRLPVAKCLDIILQVCAGLNYAHSRGIVHGDIKPGNIFILKDERAKILDFGLACPPGTTVTKLVGTPKYCSPEQIKLQPVDERSDIYSLGVAAFRILTGQEAFQGFDIANLLHMHLYDSIPDPRAYVPDMPEELCEFLLRATSKDPSARYQNVGQIIHELRPLSQRLGISVHTGSRRNNNMMSLFLFYRDDHQPMIKQLVRDFTQELEKVGAVLREADFKDV